jgi:hypothetical protein
MQAKTIVFFRKKSYNERQNKFKEEGFYETNCKGFYAREYSKAVNMVHIAVYGIQCPAGAL